MVYLNSKYGFVAKVGKRSADNPKGFMRVAESFTADLRRAAPFKSFSDAHTFAKENAFEYWTVVEPAIMSDHSHIDVHV